jgi:ssDNA-binding Zn-finger/Zn-ribbon topoisomerase 1
MIIRDGKYGKFMGCSQYPKCRGMRKEDGTPIEVKKKKWGKKK